MAAQFQLDIFPRTKPQNADPKRKKAKAFGLWLSCHTQEEIAEVVDNARNTISIWEEEFVKNSEVEELTNWSNYKPPIYNVWKQQNKSNKVNHFGNSEPQWLENLIYFYTGPGDIVVDPFAGHKKARPMMTGLCASAKNRKIRWPQGLFATPCYPRPV